MKHSWPDPQKAELPPSNSAPMGATTDTPRVGGSRANLYTLARSPLAAHASTAVSVSRITSSGCETIAT